MISFFKVLGGFNLFVTTIWLVFYFNGIDTFDFKIFECNGCEKIDDEVVEEINEAGNKDDNAEEEEEWEKQVNEDNEDEDYANTPEVMEVKDEDEEEQLGKRKRKGKAKQEKFDIYGAEIFKSGEYRQPANPYFVTKKRRDKRDMLYIPADIVKDMEYELPKTLNVCDSRGKIHRLQLNAWEDGRVWYRNGWRRLCSRNCVGEKDVIVCEFIKRDEQQEVEMQINITPAGNSTL